MLLNLKKDFLVARKEALGKNLVSESNSGIVAKHPMSHIIIKPSLFWRLGR